VRAFSQCLTQFRPAFFLPTPNFAIGTMCRVKKSIKMDPLNQEDMAKGGSKEGPCLKEGERMCQDLLQPCCPGLECVEVGSFPIHIHKCVAKTQKQTQKFGKITYPDDRYLAAERVTGAQGT